MKKPDLTFFIAFIILGISCILVGTILESDICLHIMVCAGIWLCLGELATIKSKLND